MRLARERIGLPTRVNGAGRADSARAAFSSNTSAPLIPHESRRVVGATETTCAVAPLFSASAIASAFHHENNLDGVNGNAKRSKMLRSKSQVNSETFKVNSERRRVMQRNLRYVTALAAGADTREDAKVIAAETGVAVSEIYELRAARRNPQLDVWYALLQRRPDLHTQARRIISGEATPDEIAKLIEFFQRKSG